MGRELKRVPLDFQWPMNAIWKGYINPYRSVKCKACDGSGYSGRARKYNEEWYDLDNYHIYCQPNPYRQGCTYNPHSHRYRLTQIEIDALLKEGRLKLEWLAGNKATPETVKEWLLKDSFGFDGISHHVCLSATAEAEGWDPNCPYCNGEGEHWFSDEIMILHDEWRKQDPPTGEGFQLWTTTNEGAPISPVFSTLEELAKWCETGATVFGSDKLTYEQWLVWFQKECPGYEIAPGVIVL